MVGDVMDFDAHEEDELDGGEGTDIPTPPEVYLDAPSPPMDSPRATPGRVSHPTPGAAPINLRVRTRGMPAALIQKWPDVFSMLITNKDGSQILFVRGKGE